MTAQDKSIAFFYDNAGYSYNPKTETKEEGRRRCAVALATAEEWATGEGISFVWDVDPEIDSSEFSDETPPWQLFMCVALNMHGESLASLGGIDFGRDGQPWDQAYRRVVEAELALEAMPD